MGARLESYVVSLRSQRGTYLRLFQRRSNDFIRMTPIATNSSPIPLLTPKRRSTDMRQAERVRTRLTRLRLQATLMVARAELRAATYVHGGTVVKLRLLIAPVAAALGLGLAHGQEPGRLPVAETNQQLADSVAAKLTAGTTAQVRMPRV